MIYLLVSILLVVVINIYFRLATKAKIVDIPNERSSHTKPTIRGGGIIIPLSVLFYLLFTESPNFFVGGAVIIAGIVAFLDDLYSLSPLIRLIGYLTSIILAFYGLDMLAVHPALLALILIVAAGVLNAYNFMDGINGITALYSIVALVTLIFINYTENFIPQVFLIISLCATLIFSYYNVRKRARCFAGDVGAVSIGLIIVIGIIALIRLTNNFSYILFLAVYGVDSVLTIIHRLLRKENIFKAHRSHLYQYLTNIKGFSHLQVAGMYAASQLVINIFIILFASYTSFTWYIVFAIVLIPLGIVYIITKRKIILEVGGLK